MGPGLTNADANGRGKARRLRRLTAMARELEVYDPRTPDEIIGYDDRGLPA